MLVHQMYVKHGPGTSVILPLITSMSPFHFTTVSQAKWINYGHHLGFLTPKIKTAYLKEYPPFNHLTYVLCIWKSVT